MRRISIAGLLGVVAIFAVGLAALIQATDFWVGVIYALTIGLLMASLLVVIFRGWRSGAWLGFAVFGWGSLLLGNISGLNLATEAWLLSDSVAGWVFSTSNPIPAEPAVATVQGTSVATPEYEAYLQARRDKGYDERSPKALMIGRLLWVLIFAGVGAIVGSLLARPRRSAGVVPADPQPLVG